MCNYTPTTEEIKTWYAGAVDEYRCDTGMSYDEAVAAFDRWLCKISRSAKAEALRNSANIFFTTQAISEREVKDWLNFHANLIETDKDFHYYFIDAYAVDKDNNKLVLEKEKLSGFVTYIESNLKHGLTSASIRYANEAIDAMKQENFELAQRALRNIGCYLIAAGGS